MIPARAPRKGVYIIAEIGTSHQGDESQLEALIREAAGTGADCAKFQWVIADEIIHPNTGVVPLPTGAIRLYDRFRELEVGPEFYARAKSLCDRYRIDFLCTPFGEGSAQGLRDLGAGAYKIASPELNHHPLVRQLASYGRPLIISSGVSTLADIDETLGIVRTMQAGMGTPDGKLPLVSLLHCITSYPAPEEEFNLLLIRTLSDVLGVPVGLSDHSMDPVLVPALAVLLGAHVVEKHFTLSNDTDGLDDPIALAPEAFSSMVKALRHIGNSGWTETLASVREPGDLASNCAAYLAELGSTAAPERVMAILGTGVKRLAPSEAANYGRTNRSIHVLHDLPAGHRIEAGDIAVLRTEKVLRPGIHPRHLEVVTGRILAEAVPAGEGLRWQDLA